MKFAIPDEIVDEIVKEELKKAYLLNSIPDKVDCSNDVIEVDVELLNALYIVMDYFIPANELYDWMSDGRLGHTEHPNTTDKTSSEYEEKNT